MLTNAPAVVLARTFAPGAGSSGIAAGSVNGPVGIRTRSSAARRRLAAPGAGLAWMLKGPWVLCALPALVETIVCAAKGRRLLYLQR